MDPVPRLHGEAENAPLRPGLQMGDPPLVEGDRARCPDRQDDSPRLRFPLREAVRLAVARLARISLARIAG